MKYLGNYASWIDPSWISYLLANNGTLRPKTTKANPDSPEFRIASAAGYNLENIYWHHYDQDSCPLNISPPIVTDKSVMWWFIKMMPGHFMPMHRDPHITLDKEKTNCTRYWMPLQDYSPGHIFIYKETFMTNYKAGDLWEYDDANELHGACNIGYTPRLTFQFTTYDNSIN